MTRAQEYALNALIDETKRLGSTKFAYQSNDELSTVYITEEQFGTLTSRLATAWTCYGQGEYRECVMALMDD